MTAVIDLTPEELGALTPFQAKWLRPWNTIRFDGIDDKLVQASAPATAPPILIVASVTPLASGEASQRYLVSLGESGGDNYYALALWSTEKAQASCRDDSDASFAYSGVYSPISGTRMVVAAYFPTTSARYGILNGVAGTVETTARTPGDIDQTGIGLLYRSTSSGYADVDLDWVAIFNPTTAYSVARACNICLALQNGFDPASMPSLLDDCVLFWNPEDSGACIGCNFTPTGTTEINNYSVIPTRLGGVAALDPAVLKPGLVSGDNLKPGLVTSSYGSGFPYDPAQLKAGLLDENGNLKPGMLNADKSLKACMLK